MRHIGFILLTLMLTACSMNEMADKIWPETVKTQSLAAVDAVINNQPQYFSDIKDFVPDMEQADFNAAVKSALDMRSKGKEISRNVVGANANISTSTSDGTSKTYEAIYEVKTEEGYILISLRYTLDPETQNCCRLDYLNVQASETSPHYENFVSMMKIMKVAIPIVFLIIFSLIGFFIWRGRKKKSAA